MSPKKRKAPHVKRPPFLTQNELEIGAIKKIVHWEYKDDNKKNQTLSIIKHLSNGCKIEIKPDGTQYYIHADGTKTEKTK